MLKIIRSIVIVRAIMIMSSDDIENSCLTIPILFYLLIFVYLSLQIGRFCPKHKKGWKSSIYNYLLMFFDCFF